MEFEKAIEYRELLEQCAGSGPEAEDHKYRWRRQGYHCYWQETNEDAVVQVFFIRDGKTDRKRPFSYLADWQREEEQGYPRRLL